MLSESQMLSVTAVFDIVFDQEPTENYKDIDLSFTYDYVRERYNFTDYQDTTAFSSTFWLSLSIGFMCHMQLGSPQIQEFIK